MATTTLEPYAASASELKAQLEAERRGRPFLLYRDGEGRQQIVELSEAVPRLTIGRRPTSEVPLHWDSEVSRAHAELERVGNDWTLVDDGLSRNGSFVNGKRLAGRCRLCDRDTIRVGGTVLVFRDPSEPVASTAVAEEPAEVGELSETQRKVLVALARPFRDASTFPTPTTNQEIARELFLSVDAVKAHLRVLFQKFGVDQLPPNRKRVALVGKALRAGVVSFHDL